jgi:hypothetical protein
MESGKWKVENGKWKMESGKWKVENEKWKMKNGKLRIAAKPPFGKNGKWKAMLPICRCYTAFQHDEYLSTNMPPLCGCITFEFAYAIILSGFNQNDIAP